MTKKINEDDNDPHNHYSWVGDELFVGAAGAEDWTRSLMKFK